MNLMIVIFLQVGIKRSLIEITGTLCIDIYNLLYGLLEENTGVQYTIPYGYY